MKKSIDLFKVGVCLLAIATPEVCRATSIALFGGSDDYRENLARFYGAFLGQKSEVSTALFKLSIGSSLICYKAITSKTPISCCLAIATCAAQALISNYICRSGLIR